ncbi:serine/threonine protein kinase [Actinomadura madurae]|uniref:serine/threonine-protein kinase n=1 Tax=Actinomadura madurae TaxID=1993 RepID=UPI0020260436|nr:serine/threonine-protein kinase [Actinomadura madurae]URM94834.1 serine/threonine protein kinase [Actinomadura madurae]
MTAEVAPLRPGDPSQLGSYRLTGLLGEGGQGAVYLGEDEPGHRVAVKLLHARFSGDPKARSRFAAEVAVAKRVSAFCTARVLDSDVEGDRPYIVSEYIDGPALSDVLTAEGPRRGADLDRLAIGTMTALAAIHQAGVVHRDFKPANVLLAPDGPRVIDFGIARALDATGTMSSTAIGTPAYMAPEQISGARVGPAADVFAWAATMVYAATARPAFGQDSIPAVMHRILNLPPDLGDLQEPLRRVVTDCLSKDPALRPASQQVLAHLLELAGSLPQPSAPQGGADALMLTQGAQTAATESVQLRVQTPPPFPQPPIPGPQTPPPMPGPAWPSPAPPPNGGTPGTWPGAGHPGQLGHPGGFTTPSGTGGRRGITVLASAGAPCSPCWCSPPAWPTSSFAETPRRLLRRPGGPAGRCRSRCRHRRRSRARSTRRTPTPAPRSSSPSSCSPASPSSAPTASPATASPRRSSRTPNAGSGRSRSRTGRRSATASPSTRRRSPAAGRAARRRRPDPART